MLPYDFYLSDGQSLPSALLIPFKVQEKPLQALVIQENYSMPYGN